MGKPAKNKTNEVEAGISTFSSIEIYLKNEEGKLTQLPFNKLVDVLDGFND